MLVGIMRRKSFRPKHMEKTKLVPLSLEHQMKLVDSDMTSEIQMHLGTGLPTTVFQVEGVA